MEKVKLELADCERILRLLKSELRSTEASAESAGCDARRDQEVAADLQRYYQSEADKLCLLIGRVQAACAAVD